MEKLSRWSEWTEYYFVNLEGSPKLIGINTSLLLDGGKLIYLSQLDLDLEELPLGLETGQEANPDLDHTAYCLGRQLKVEVTGDCLAFLGRAFGCFSLPQKTNF